MALEWKEVKSGSMRRIGFDASTYDLQIEFHSGGLYLYKKVPKEKADGLLNALSKNAYFVEHIRPHHECICLTRAPKKEKDASQTQQPAEPQESKGKGKKARKIQPI
jgi:KTSC domain-containing protein